VTLDRQAQCVRFEDFTRVKIPIVVVRIMITCSLVGDYQRFGGT
jgi:hypothetical protein